MTVLAGTLALAAFTTSASAQDKKYDYDEGDRYSTIGDNPVAVGERNRYEYEHKTFNIATNPLGLIWGSYGISAGYAVAKNVVLRADIAYSTYSLGYSSSNWEYSGIEFGLGAPIYFSKAFSGFFLEPGVLVRQVSATYTAPNWDYDADGNYVGSGTQESTSSETVFGPSVMLGYHWMWDSGLNLALAAGIGRNIGGSDSDAFSDFNNVFFNSYFNVGYAFD